MQAVKQASASISCLRKTQRIQSLELEQQAALSASHRAQESSHTVAALRNDVRTLRASLADAEQQLAAGSAAMGDTAKSSMAVQTDLKRVTAERDAAQGALDAAQAHLQSQHEAITALQSAVHASGESTDKRIQQAISAASQDTRALIQAAVHAETVRWSAVTERMQAEVAAAEQRVAARDAGMSDLRATLMEEIVVLRNTLQASEAASVQEVQALQQVAAGARRALADARQLAHAERDSAEGQLRAAVSQAATRESQMAAELRTLRSQVEAMTRETLRASGSDSHALQVQVDSLQRRLAETVRSHEVSESTRVQQVSELQEEIASRDAAAAAYASADTQQASDLRKAHQEQVRILETSLKSANAAISELRGTMEGLRGDKQGEASAASRDAQATVAATQDALLAGKSALQIEQTARAAAVGTTASLQSQLQAQADTFKQQQTRLQQMLAEHQASAEAERSRCDATCKAAHDRADTAEAQRQQAQAQVASLRSELGAMQTAREAAALSCKESINALTAQVQAAEQDMLSAQQDSATAVAAVTQRLQAVQEATLQAEADARSRCAALQEKLNAASQRNEQQAAAHRQAVSNVQAAHAAACRELKQEAQAAHRGEAAAVEQLRALRAAASAEAARLQADAAAARSQAQAATAQLEAARSTHAAELQVAQDRATLAEQQLQAGSDEIKCLRGELESAGADTGGGGEWAAVLAAAQAANGSAAAASQTSAGMRAAVQQSQMRTQNALRDAQESIAGLNTEARNAVKQLTALNDGELTAAASSTLATATSAANEEAAAYRTMRLTLQQQHDELQSFVQATAGSSTAVGEKLQAALHTLQEQQTALDAAYAHASEEALHAVQRLGTVCTNVQERSEQRVASIAAVADAQAAAMQEAAAQKERQVQAATAAIQTLRADASSAEAAALEKQRILAQELEQLRGALAAARAATLTHDKQVRSREAALAEDIKHMQQRQRVEDATAAAAFAGARQEWEGGVQAREGALRTELAASRANAHDLAETLQHTQQLHEEDVSQLQGRLEELVQASAHRQALLGQERQATEAGLQALQVHANDAAAVAANERAQLVASLAAAYAQLGLQPSHESS